MVFDKDTADHFEAAIERCENNGVNAAWSNPCFEHWLNLHESDQNAHYSQKQAQQECEKRLSDYKREKGKSCDFASIMDKVQQAEQRAETQLNRANQDGDKKGHKNPTTSVFRLTQSIRTAHEQSSRRRK